MASPQTSTRFTKAFLERLRGSPKGVLEGFREVSEGVSEEVSAGGSEGVSERVSWVSKGFCDKFSLEQLTEIFYSATS